MKQSLACVGVLTLIAACSNSDPASGGGAHAGSPGSAGSAGTATAQGGSAAPSAGAPSGGGTASGGTSSGGTSSGGSGMSGAPTAGANSAGTSGAASGGAGGAGGMAGTGFKCPAGPYATLDVAGKTAAPVPGAPPEDAFNMNNWTNVEGPVWIGDSLYFSEMTGMNLPPARILKIGPGNAVSVAVADSGSNGLAVDDSGALFAAVHKDGSISKVALPGGMETPIVSMFGQPAVRFNSPNDLAIRHDGTIYFSDPNFQNSGNPQNGERLYRISPTHMVSNALNPTDMGYLRPNGVTLSPDEQTLYVTSSSVKKFAVMADGTLGAGADFASSVTSGDGMVVDCAGNLYVSGGSPAVKVFSSAGAMLGTIMLGSGGGTTTNVAFGGTDHQTLYITAQGNQGQRGVFSVKLNVPGFPY